MKGITLICLLFASFSLAAQPFQKEINDQVWTPFIASFGRFDTDAFMGLHSKDIIRSPRDSKSLWNWDEYKTQMEGIDKRGKERREKRTIELRFTERLANAAQAIDVGVYKTSVTNAEGEKVSFYGRFHVVMRKEQGVWKILVDTDSSEGNRIGENEFMAAKPLE